MDLNSAAGLGSASVADMVVPVLDTFWMGD